jgi:Domain of unknown function (DUF5615)
MIRLYMDENVRGAITRGLRRRGIDVLTVQEDGREETPDPRLLDRAIDLGRVLYTEDDDLLREATHRQRSSIPFSGVVYAHPLGVAIGQCVDDLELIALICEPAELENDIRYLPLR